MFRKSYTGLYGDKTAEVKLVRSFRHPCWIMDGTGYSVHAKDKDASPASGLKAFAALMWGQDAKAKSKIGLVTECSIRSSIPNILATVAQSLDMQCKIIVNEMDVATLQTKLVDFPDCLEAIAKGAEFIPSGSTAFSDALVAKWVTDHPDYSLLPSGFHTEAFKQFSIELVHKLKAAPFIDTLVAPIGSGFSLASMIQGLQQHNLCLPVVGVAGHVRDIGLIFDELKKAGIDIQKNAEENYVLTLGAWHSELSIERYPDQLQGIEKEKCTHFFMDENIPLDPGFEAKCVPVIEKLIANQHKPLLWNVSCSPVFAQQLKNAHELEMQTRKIKFC